MNAHEVLTKTRELLTPPEAWTKETLARTADHQLVGPLHPNATCWCLAGGMLKTMNASDPDKAGQPYFEAVELLRIVTTPGVQRSIASFNDHPRTTHVAVLRALDRAIILARS